MFDGRWAMTKMRMVIERQEQEQEQQQQEQRESKKEEWIDYLKD
jgi:hypothetical protein